MKAKLIFIVKAIAASALFFIIWSWMGDIYTAFLTRAATGIRGVFGASEVAVRKENFSYYFIPAFSLIFASQEMLSRKVRYLAVAMAVIIG